MKRLIQSRLLAVVALTSIVAITAFWVSVAFAQQPTSTGATPPSAAPAAGGPAPAPSPPVIGPGAAPSPLGLPGAAPAITVTPAGELPGGPTPPVPAAGGPPPFPGGHAPAHGGTTQWGPRLAQPDTIRAELDALLEQESHTRQLMSQYSQLADENQREAIVRELSRVVTQQFDTRQEIRNRELERLEVQIRKLRELHDKRARFRNEIIHERVRQLLRDLDGLGWGAEGVELAPQSRGMGMPAPAIAPVPATPAPQSSSTHPRSAPRSAVAWSPANKHADQSSIDASQPAGHSGAVR
jgi:hypothetical protein